MDRPVMPVVWASMSTDTKKQANDALTDLLARMLVGAYKATYDELQILAQKSFNFDAIEGRRVYLSEGDIGVITRALPGEGKYKGARNTYDALSLEVLAWRKFRKGVGLTDEDLGYCIGQAEDALPYLEARLPEYALAYNATVMDLEALRNFARNRQERERCEANRF